jgi:hypothetical protein
MISEDPATARADHLLETLLEDRSKINLAPIQQSK